MATICPKCKHLRPPDATNPDWQCPACGICYAKFSPPVPAPAAPAYAQHAIALQPAWNIPWFKLVFVAALAWGAWTAREAAFIERHAGLSPAALSALASTVQAGEVVMYSTTTCVYCRKAKSWLSQYGFAYTECNISVNRDCKREFSSYGAKGVPFLLVRGEQMNGWSSDNFVAVLQQTPGAGGR